MYKIATVPLLVIWGTNFSFGGSNIQVKIFVSICFLKPDYTTVSFTHSYRPFFSTVDIITDGNLKSGGEIKRNYIFPGDAEQFSNYRGSQHTIVSLNARRRKHRRPCFRKSGECVFDTRPLSWDGIHIDNSQKYRGRVCPSQGKYFSE